MSNGRDHPEGPPPEDDMVLVDPVGLGFVHKKPLKQARGLAGAIYRWLGIEGDRGLPPAAKQALTEEGKTKLLRYADKCEVIHVVVQTSTSAESRRRRRMASSRELTLTS